MKTTLPMKTQLLVSALLLATAVVVYAYPLQGGDTQAAPVNTPVIATAQQPRPVVEVVFVLDTTGSMGGLIEGAKRRIWTIARRVGEGRPRPELAVALVACGDAPAGPDLVLAFKK